MFAKKTQVTLSAGALLAAAAPAFADHDNWRHGHRVQQRVVVEQHPVVVRERTVVVERPVYRAPAYGYGQPVYGYGQPVYSEPVYAPAPVYAERDNTAATIGGAALGAFIGSQVGHGPDRAAAVAAGALIGGIIGSNF